MSIRINGSGAGLNAVRNISLIQRSISRTAQRPASVSEVSQTAEGIADAMSSEQMRSQIGSLTQQIKNLEFSVNRTRAADSAISELREKLNEIKGVAVQAADEASATPESGKVYQKQVNAAISTYNQRLDTAEYAGAKLLDGSQGSVCRLAPLADLDVSTPNEASQSLNKVSLAKYDVETAQDMVDASSRNEYQKTVRTLEVASQNLVAADNQILDTDSAREQALYLKELLQRQSGMAAVSQGNLAGDAVFKLLHA